MKRKKQKEPVGMNIAEIFNALALLEEDRGIPQAFMLEKITQAIVSAYKRDHPGVDNVEIDTDKETKTLRMFVVKKVVADEDYTNPGNEISLEEAKKIYARYEPGDEVNIPVDNVEFGRIAAGNGKQVIIQGLREAERGMIYDEFSSKQHEILTGTVMRVDPRNGNATVKIGTGNETTEVLLTQSEQIPGEEIVDGMLLKVYIVSVNRSTRGPQILISRTHPGLVRRLFELEVPELYDGTVEIKSISREAGSRSKLAVWSNDENVDPVGACVGPRGQRVANVVAELRGEKIDIIKYDEDMSKFISAALSPANVTEVRVSPDGRFCRAIVPDHQLSLAIGREGQNARLAAKLTGCKIDIKAASAKDIDENWPPAPPAPKTGDAKPENARDDAEADAKWDTKEEIGLEGGDPETLREFDRLMTEMDWED